MDHVMNNTDDSTSEDITLVTPKEVTEEIRINLNTKKAADFDLIIGTILKQLFKKV